MAIGGIASTGGVNKKYPGKLTHFVLRSCLVAAMGGLIFGYDIGISGSIKYQTKAALYLVYDMICFSV